MENAIPTYALAWEAMAPTLAPLTLEPLAAGGGAAGDLRVPDRRVMPESLPEDSARVGAIGLALEPLKEATQSLPPASAVETVFEIAPLQRT